MTTQDNPQQMAPVAPIVNFAGAAPSEIRYFGGMPVVWDGRQWVRLVVPIKVTGVAAFVCWVAAVLMILAFVAWAFLFLIVGSIGAALN